MPSAISPFIFPAGQSFRVIIDRKGFKARKSFSSLTEAEAWRDEQLAKAPMPRANPKTGYKRIARPAFWNAK